VKSLSEHILLAMSLTFGAGILGATGHCYVQFNTKCCSDAISGPVLQRPCGEGNCPDYINTASNVNITDVKEAANLQAGSTDFTGNNPPPTPIPTCLWADSICDSNGLCHPGGPTTTHASSCPSFIATGSPCTGTR
jgi:hypothetical protein